MIVKVTFFKTFRAPDRRIWFQRPHLAICRHLDDGEFRLPSHLSANLSFCVLGIRFTFQGRKETWGNVCER